jgi:hypothetical protein
MVPGMASSPAWSRVERESSFLTKMSARMAADGVLPHNRATQITACCTFVCVCVCRLMLHIADEHEPSHSNIVCLVLVW